MLIFFDNYCHAKHLIYYLIPSRDIDGQRTLKSDWTRRKTDFTLTLVVILTSHNMIGRDRFRS